MELAMIPLLIKVFLVMVCLMSIKRFPNKIYTLQFGFKLTIDSDFLMEPLFKASLIALNKGFLLY